MSGKYDYQRYIYCKYREPPMCIHVFGSAFAAVITFSHFCWQRQLSFYD
jgi:hypothetical protein